MLDYLKNVNSPTTLATIAVVVGMMVRVLKTKKVSDLLDSVPAAWIARVPKKYLPWVAVVLGMLITFLDAKFNTKMPTKDAAILALNGILAGGTAIGGNETIMKLLTIFKASPNMPDEPPPGAPKGSEAPLPPVAPTPPPMIGGMLMMIVMAVSLVTATPGCAALVGALPSVIAAVMDGGQVLDTIAQFLSKYFAAHPDLEKQAAVDKALLKARSALNLALRAAEGAKAADDKNVDLAFENFKAAYLELLNLVKPYGVAQAMPGAPLQASASGDKLDVPEPLAFKARKK